MPERDEFLIDGEPADVDGRAADVDAAAAIEMAHAVVAETAPSPSELTEAETAEASAKTAGGPIVGASIVFDGESDFGGGSGVGGEPAAHDAVREAGEQLAALESENEALAVGILPMPSDESHDDPATAMAIRIARGALEDITASDDIGEFVGFDDEGDGVYSARFTTTIAGYPGWYWTVSMIQLADADEPSVLETELLPGDEAMLAPAWLPWAERLAKYKAEHSGDADARGDDEGPRAIALARRERRRVRTRVGADGERTSVAQPGASEAGDGDVAGPGDETATDAQGTGSRARDSQTRDDQAGGEDAPTAAGSETAGTAAAVAGESAGTSRRRERRRIASPRRRVTVSGRVERRFARSRGAAAASAEPGVIDIDDELVEAPDIREFADDMDDVLDGVDFEPEVDDAEETEVGEAEKPEPKPDDE